MGFWSDVTRGVEDVATGGLAEFTQSNPFGVPNGGQYLPLVAGAGLGALLGNPGAGLSAGTALFGARSAAQAQADANATNQAIAQGQMQFSAAQAREQMAFQADMSNTSVQRMKADMQAAGINPMLAAGNGESTPAGAMGQSAGTRVDPVPSVALTALNSASQLMSTYGNFKSSIASADASAASAKKMGVETGILKNQSQATEFEGKIFSWLNRFVGALGSDAKSLTRPNVIQPPDVKISPSGSVQDGSYSRSYSGQ